MCDDWSELQDSIIKNKRDSEKMTRRLRNLTGSRAMLQTKNGYKKERRVRQTLFLLAPVVGYLILTNEASESPLNPVPLVTQLYTLTRRNLLFHHTSSLLPRLSFRLACKFELLYR